MAITIGGPLGPIYTSTSRNFFNKSIPLNVVEISYGHFPHYSQSVSTGATETITLGTTFNGNDTATVGGIITTGDILTIKISAPYLTNRQELVTYTVRSTDTRESIASGLADAFNANVELVESGLSATSAITVVSMNQSVPTYTASTNGGATETISLDTNIVGCIRATIGGTITAGDTLAITVHDKALRGGQESITYMVLPSDTLSIVEGLTEALNSDAELSRVGVTADYHPI
jgi:hypothetical protein